MSNKSARELREWIKTQEPRFSRGDALGPALWRLTGGGTEGGRTTLDALVNATGLSAQETRALVLIYSLEGYLVHHDSDEIEITERGVLWLITGGQPERRERGLDRTYYAGIERGERNPSVKNLAKIAVALGVPIGTLFDEESPPEG